jgi:hypothetical protein
MNASIIYKTNVKSNVLDELAKDLPVIIAEVMEVPGGNVARLKPGEFRGHNAIFLISIMSPEWGTRLKLGFPDGH